MHVFPSRNHRRPLVETIGVAVGAETHDRTLYRGHVWQPCCPGVRVRSPLPDVSRSRSELASNDSPFRTCLFDLFQHDRSSRASTPDRCRQRISKPSKIVPGLIPAFLQRKSAHALPHVLRAVPGAAEKFSNRTNGCNSGCGPTGIFRSPAIPMPFD